MENFIFRGVSFLQGVTQSGEVFTVKFEEILELFISDEALRFIWNFVTIFLIFLFLTICFSGPGVDANYKLFNLDYFKYGNALKLKSLIFFKYGNGLKLKISEKIWRTATRKKEVQCQKEI